MLETRERGVSYGLFLRKSARPYLILLLVYGVLLSVLVCLDLWMPFVLMVGMLLGCLLRDVGWVRRIKQTWPFTLKTTDWDIVQRLAEKSDSTGAGDAQ